ncbi:MAG: magnesium/cobalt transporter CorA, partial [Dehalococcoidia bacterium]
MPFKACYLSDEGDLRHDIGEAEVKAAYDSRRGLLWVDISQTTVDDGAFLSGSFAFHQLAIEDCISTAVHSPKIDDFGDHIFLIVHGIDYTSESEIVETTELCMFIGQNFVVSAHHVPLYSINLIGHLVRENGSPMKRGADFLAYSIVDALVDNVMPTVDKMGDVAEEIEEEIIRLPRQSSLEDILKLKRSTLRMHRVLSPQRETLNRLSRGDFKIISQDARIFYRDIYDHIVRIEDMNQTLRDRADNALSTYLSSVANRQNEVMKVLSIVAAIFLPLTLLAGVYGMNFENMPELNWRWGYFAVIGFMATVLVLA